MTRPRTTVLFDANSLMVQRTGVGHYTAGLIDAIARTCPDFDMVGYYYNFLGRKTPPTSPIATNIHYRPILHFPGPAVNLLRRFRIEVPLELLTLTKADFALYPNFLSQTSLRRTPGAPVIHDLMYYDLPQYGSDKSVRDLTTFVPPTLRRSDFVLTVSDSTKQRIVEVYGHDPERILATFIPPVEAQWLADDKAKVIVGDQGIHKPYLLFVGTMEPRKNLTSLLEAYHLLPRQVRDSYSLVLAGKMDWKYQETKQKLERLQAAGDDIHYLGYIDNDTRAALYQQARLTVLPSHYEGFGMQILESMQYGTPCAVSDLPVLREVGGDMAVYFDQNTPQAIADSIDACLRQPKPDIATLQRYVASRPNWDQVGAQVGERIRQSVRHHTTSQQPAAKEQS